MSSRSNLMKAHLLLATFIFPAILMFLVTGGLYTWGIKGSYVDQEYTIALTEPMSADSGALKTLAQGELSKLSLSAPTGGAKVKQSGDSIALEWGGSKRDVVLESTADQLTATLTVKETTWYRNLVQLHKAKGGEVFKVYAAFLAVSLFLILFTGFIIGLQMPKYRRMATISSLLGIVVFGLAVAAS